MKTTMKTLIASFALFALTGMAQAQNTVQVTEVTTVEPVVQITEMNATQSVFGPGYSDSIDMADIQNLDNAINAIPEFVQPNNFMSDEGVYRYAYYDKTGVWLTLGEAKAALNNQTPVQNY